MKALLLKGFVAVATCFVAVSASAMCTCTVDNNANKTHWVGKGPTKDIAIQHAQGYCARHANRPINCQNTGCVCN